MDKDNLSNNSEVKSEMKSQITHNFECKAAELGHQTKQAKEMYEKICRANWAESQLKDVDSKLLRLQNKRAELIKKVADETREIEEAHLLYTTLDKQRADAHEQLKDWYLTLEKSEDLSADLLRNVEISKDGRVQFKQRSIYTYFDTQPSSNHSSS